MQKTNRIVFVGVLVSLLLWGSCSKDNTVTATGKNPTYYNIILVLDLSSRLKEAGQIQRDKQVISLILDLFEQRQRQLAYTSSQDKLTIAYQGPNLGLAGLAQNLHIDMKGANKPKFELAKEELLSTIDQLYAAAEKGVFFDFDYWSFFRDNISSYLEPQGQRVQFKNKCVVLSNGYFVPGNAEVRPLGTCFQPRMLEQLRKVQGDWEQAIDNGSVTRLLPHEHLDFGNLEVAMLEVCPENPTSNLYETAFLERLWGDWFTKMGVDFSFHLSADQERTQKILIDFLSKKNLWTSMKIKVPLSGELYSCHLVEHPEIVRGYRGKYFLVHLKHAISKRRLEFPAGRYYLDDFADYKDALGEFGQKVIRTIDAGEGKFAYRVFVKGQADLLGNETFRANFASDFRFNEVCFFPAYQNSSTFSPETLCESISEPITNADLPNLRAKFLHDRIGTYLNELFAPFITGKGALAQLASGPTILDGNVSLQISDQDRNAILFLFLPENFFE